MLRVVCIAICVSLIVVVCLTAGYALVRVARDCGDREYALYTISTALLGLGAIACAAGVGL